MGNRRSFAEHSSLIKLYQPMTVWWDMLKNVGVSDVTISPRGNFEFAKNDPFLMLFLFPHQQRGHFQWYPFLMLFLTCMIISTLHLCIGHLMIAFNRPLACNQFIRCQFPSIIICISCLISMLAIALYHFQQLVYIK